MGSCRGVGLFLWVVLFGVDGGWVGRYFCGRRDKKTIVNRSETSLKPIRTMKNTINAQLDPALWAKVTQTLKGSELARLMRALAALMNGEDPTEHLNSTGLRLAYALLSEPILCSMERHERNRVNGAKGGRPRSNRTDETEEADADGDRGLPWVRTKKSKKEDLPPTPPIEEKNKKNNIIAVDVVDSAQAREQFRQEVLNNDLRTEQACMSLHIDPGEYQALVGEVLNEWEFADEEDWSYKHLLNTLRIKVRTQSKHKDHETRYNTKRDITDTAATCAKDYEGPF